MTKCKISKFSMQIWTAKNWSSTLSLSALTIGIHFNPIVLWKTWYLDIWFHKFKMSKKNTANYHIIYVGFLNNNWAKASDIYRISLCNQLAIWTIWQMNIDHAFIQLGITDLSRKYPTVIVNVQFLLHHLFLPKQIAPFDHVVIKILFGWLRS